MPARWGIEQSARAPLEPVDVRQRIHRVQGAEFVEPWPAPILLTSVDSTNRELAGRIRHGRLPEGTCVVAEHQFAGRGRLGRVWDSPKGAGLWVSVLVDIDEVSAAQLGWLPLVVGLAISDAVREVGGIDVRLKWPNDLVIDKRARDGGAGPRKIGGILVETTGLGHGQAIVGCGVNVSLVPDELPTAAATSIFEENGSQVNRAQLLAVALTHLRRRVNQWRILDSDQTSSLRAEYRDRCLSLGRRVCVMLPGGAEIVGLVTEINPNGLLGVINSAGILRFIAAGDVVHAKI